MQKVFLFFIKKQLNIYQHQTLTNYEDHLYGIHTSTLDGDDLKVDPFPARVREIQFQGNLSHSALQKLFFD